MKPIDLVGWSSSLILLATLLQQVFKQWQTRSSTGVSKWLFTGQVIASLGYVTYSALLHNWVFLSSNIAILATAIAGELIYLKNSQSQPNRGEVDDDELSSSARYK